MHSGFHGQPKIEAVLVVTQHYAGQTGGLLRQRHLSIAGIALAIDIGVVDPNNKRVERGTEKAEVLLIVEFHTDHGCVFAVQRDRCLVKYPVLPFVVINRLDEYEIFDLLVECAS